MRNVGASSSNIVSQEMNIEDTMMDEEVEGESPIQGNLGAHSYQAFNIGVNLQS